MLVFGCSNSFVPFFFQLQRDKIFKLRSYLDTQWPDFQRSEINWKRERLSFLKIRPIISVTKYEHRYLLVGNRVWEFVALAFISGNQFLACLARSQVLNISEINLLWCARRKMFGHLKNKQLHEARRKFGLTRSAPAQSARAFISHPLQLNTFYFSRLSSALPTWVLISLPPF